MEKTLRLTLLLLVLCLSVMMETARSAADPVPSTKDNTTQDISEEVIPQVQQAEMDMSYCPEVKEGVLGICGKPCKNDSQCEDGKRCCPDACDRLSCKTIASDVPVSQTPDATSTNISKEVDTSYPVIEHNLTSTREPSCPEMTDGFLGICGEPCEDDSQCQDGKRCCPDTCDQHSCIKIES